MPGPLHFYDHHRQRYAGKPRGRRVHDRRLHRGGTVGQNGEFRITLVELHGDRRWALYPHLEVFGEGTRLLGATMAADLFPSGVSGKSEESYGFPAGSTGRFDRVREAVDSGA